MTTTTAPAGTGVSAGSPSAMASDSASPASETQNLSTAQRMAASIAKTRSGLSTPPAAASPASGSVLLGDSPDASTGAESDEEGADKTSPDESKQDAKKKTDDVVPMAAFKARIGKLSETIKATREELTTATIEREKVTAAARLLHEENERLRAQLREGRVYDPRDEELSDVRLSQRAKEEADAIEQMRAQKLAELRANFEQEAAREAMRATLSVQIDRAVGSYALASKESVIEAMKARRDLSANEAAKLIHEREQKKLEALGYIPRQSTMPPVDAPAGVRAPGSSGGSSGRDPNNAAGYLAYIQRNKR